MRCAREGCANSATVTVDFGEGLLVLLCWGDAVTAMIDGPRRRVTKLPSRTAVPVTRPREA